MCRMRNIATKKVWLPDRQTRAHGRTDARQSDPYVPLCFACDTKIRIGDMAQPEERKDGNKNVIGSTPLCSTFFWHLKI